MSEVPQPPPEMPEMPYRGEYTERARRARLGWFRATTGAALRSLDATSIDARSLPGNLENFVGCVEVPVGLAGPMLFAGEHARGHVTAPLATTEGALVASAARGARAITRAGGVVTRAVGQRMVRAPFFEFAGLGEAAEFAHRITGHHAELAAEAARVSAHSRLVELDPVQLGRTVHVRFVYETADAGGQNMTTAATWRACRWILDRLCVPPGPSPTLFGVEGNLSGDKKFSHLNMTAGRGIRVIAECVLDPDTLRAVLKTTPEAMDRFYRIGVVAAQHAGMPGFDIDAANVIAAMFVATGQDIASVYESGAAQFSVDPDGAGLRATLVLPNLVAGTVGGGTGLPHQRDYLEALGCRGDAGARRFAEIVCGFALALDLSTLAAVASGQFADAHERLGRPRRVAWATRADLGAPLLQPLLAASLDAPDLAVTGVTWPEEAAGPSIITDLTAQGERRKLLGVLPVRASWEAGGRKGTLDLVLKVKPLDQEVIIEAAKLASLCGGRLAEVYPRWRDWTGFRDLHTRELAVYRSPDPALRRVLPRAYGVHEDPSRELYVLVMERLGPDVILKDTAEDPGLWEPGHVAAAVRGLAAVHAAWLGREADLLGSGLVGQCQTAARMAAMRELWHALLEHNRTEHPSLLDETAARRLRRVIDDIPVWWARIEAMPRTLVHGDFNPRNIALRAGDLSLVAYDWELATLHVPQRDLVDLLAYVLPGDAGEHEVAELVALHRQAVVAAGGAAPDAAVWREGFRLALWDFAVTRLQLYLMAHTHRELPFLRHVVPTVLRLLEIEDHAGEAVGVRSPA